MALGELTIFRPLRNINATLGAVINHGPRMTKDPEHHIKIIGGLHDSF
jgi:hypothetical protein